jgi:hypothetical protein
MKLMARRARSKGVAVCSAWIAAAVSVQFLYLPVLRARIPIVEQARAEYARLQ